MKSLLLAALLFTAGAVSAQTVVEIKVLRTDNGLPIADRVVSLQTLTGDVVGNAPTNSLGIATLYVNVPDDYVYKLIDCTNDSIADTLTVPPSTDTVAVTDTICVPSGSDCTGDVTVDIYPYSSTAIYASFNINTSSLSYITQVYIDYGDGTIEPYAFTSYHSHEYAAPGLYPIEIYAHTSDVENIGCTVHILDTIDVFYTACDPSYTVTPDSLNELLYHYQANNPDTVHLQAGWMLSAGGYGFTGIPNADYSGDLSNGTYDHLFPARGFYSLGRYVYYPAIGCYSIETDTVNVGNVVVEADFTLNVDSLIFGLPVGSVYTLKNLSDNALFAGYTVDGGYLNFIYNYDSTATVIFDTPGNHTVCLYVYALENGPGGINYGVDTLCLEQYVDSSVFYSPRLAGINEESNNNNILLYPNPTNATATIKIEASSNSKAVVNIVNMVGQVIYNQTLNLKAGSNYQLIDASTFAKGLYYISITTNGKQTTQKLVKY